MDITPLIKENAKIIKGYGPGIIRIGDTSYDTPVLVTSDQVTEWNFTGDPKNISEQDCGILSEYSSLLDVVLLGGGDNMPFIKNEVLTSYRTKGISIEPMDTGAACRTYNVLLAEGRRVGALLVPPALK